MSAEILAALHPPPEKLPSLRSVETGATLILHEDPVQAPARNRVAFMVQVCDEWGQIQGHKAQRTPVWS